MSFYSKNVINLSEISTHYNFLLILVYNYLDFKDSIIESRIPIVN